MLSIRAGYISLLLAAFLCLAGCSGKRKTEDTPTGDPKPGSGNAAIEMTAEDLARETRMDPLDFAKKYSGKTLQLRGKVQQVEENMSRLFLGNGMKSPNGDPVNIVVYFPDKTTTKTIQVGSTVVIESKKVSGDQRGVVCDECRLIKKE